MPGRIISTAEEALAANAVMSAVRAAIRAKGKIPVPGRTTAGFVANPFGGSIGAFAYQFDGEEDLLHLAITRRDGGRLTAEDAQHVAAGLLSGVETSLIWLRPGEFSQHFYIGHDDLVNPNSGG